ncbi:hypothetical protein CHU98_g7974 [Xylaria longipes]|nr:hypothetical protein CHU98_g7974 [Xylaria longipes]
MTASFPKKLSNGTFSALGSTLDQQMVLRYIRSISLVELPMINPLAIMQLPKTLRAFSKLENIQLLCGYEKVHALGPQIHVTDIPVCRAEWRCAPTELKRLLGSIGMADGVVLQVALRDGRQWSEFQT